MGKIMNNLNYLLEIKDNKDFAYEVIYVLRRCPSLSIDIINNLADLAFCKKNFDNLYYSVLKEIPNDVKQGDLKSYTLEGTSDTSRYYDTKFFFFGKTYFITSEWYYNGAKPENRPSFVKWLENLYNKQGTLGFSSRGSSFSGSIDNIILYGPPGTGKTYKMQHEYIDKFAKEDRFITTFHQSFSYEEFVEGLKPVLADKPDGDTSSDVKYKIEKGIFYKACEHAAKIAGYEPTENETSLQKCIADVDRSTKMDEAIKENKIVLLCIDEINRANVSAVFGDLISLIEPSKRIGAKNEMVVSLPYSKEAFAVPANLMIVGTMNTADRSIQLLDSALRRRFRFEELLPDYDVINDKTAKEILKAINARIRCLLDKDHQIGHSYFIDAKSDLDIFNAIKDCVIPLLEEYFYNDAQKIRQILNEKDNSETNFYITDAEAQDALEKMQNDYDDEKEFYMLNSKLETVNDDSLAQGFLSHIING